MKYVTQYKDIPYATQDAVLWRREDNGVVYIASMIRGVINETIELPKDVPVGTQWDYNDGEPSKREVTATLTLELAGLKYPDCIEVTRTVLNNKALQSVTNKSYYCKEVGEVRSLFKQPSPIGDYITETSMREYKR
ncbi:MAG: hypothetical protein QY326_01180 [Bdellovibrionota bacterium]|nr:MAG: hypothetical protein QY326_01180 [Bdellovibrionota bacterium]